MVSPTNIFKPSRSVNNILGLRYVRFTNELQVVIDTLPRTKGWLTTGWSVAVPLWIPSALMLLLWLAVLRHPVQRYLRRKNGRCVACGCDLIGQAPPVCLECGRAE